MQEFAGISFLIFLQPDNNFCCCCCCCSERKCHFWNSI